MLLCAKILGRRTTWCAKVVSCALWLLAACQPADNASPLITDAATATCQPNNHDCLLQLQPSAAPAISGHWRIDSAQIRAEQPLPFTLELANDLAIEQASATVRGVSMNMGVLPVFIDRIEANRIHGRLLLPACSSNNMIWRAEFRLTTAQGSALLSHTFHAEQ